MDGKIFMIIVESGPKELDNEALEIRTLFVAGTGKSGEGGQEYLLSPGSTTLGKSPDCNICLKHPTVSRQHAEICNNGEELTITDLNSLNGTLLNGEPLPPSVPTPLKEQDLLKIGKFELRVAGGER